MRVFFFVMFFTVGAAVLSVSVLSDDIVRYYHNRQLIKAADERLCRVVSLNKDYEALIHRLDEDPNLVKRIAPTALGVSPNEPDTVFPRAKAEQLAAARKALMAEAKEPQQRPELGTIPNWLERCLEPRKRALLFLSGAGLILVSLVCFTPRPKSDKR